MWNKKACSFFQRGNCRFGANCRDSHTTDGEVKPQERGPTPRSESKPNFPPANAGNPKICGFFLKGTCTKQACRYFHGYSDNLQNVQFEKIHDKSIVSLNAISDNKFLSADENTLKIWIITDTEHKTIGTQSFDGEKITKVTYSNEKVIAATIIEQMYEAQAQEMNEMVYSSFSFP